jgi:hypothetical protein
MKEDRMPQKNLHTRTGRDEKGKIQEKMERGSIKRYSSAGSEKMERVGGRWEKNGRTLFDRPKPTVGCSANGRRRRRRSRMMMMMMMIIIIIIIIIKLVITLNATSLLSVIRQSYEILRWAGHQCQ